MAAIVACFRADSGHPWATSRRYSRKEISAFIQVEVAWMERVSASLVFQAASFGNMIPTGPSTVARMAQILTASIRLVVLAGPKIRTGRKDWRTPASALRGRLHRSGRPVLELQHIVVG